MNFDEGARLDQHREQRALDYSMHKASNPATVGQAASRCSIATLGGCLLVPQHPLPSHFSPKGCY